MRPEDDSQEQPVQAVSAISDIPTVPIAPIRVLVSNMSGVVMESAASLIEQEPDMVLIGQVDDRVELLIAMSSKKAAGNEPDVLVLIASSVDPPPGICSHLLSEFPDLKILLLSATEDEAVAYWLGLRRYRLPTGRPAALLTNIRSVHSMSTS
jgi:DNA-binding NarL/FixJ family response regulator